MWPPPPDRAAPPDLQRKDLQNLSRSVCRRYVPHVRAMPGDTDGWWVSPAVPMIADCALAALWAFTAVGGWGEKAFCEISGRLDPSCTDGFATAVLASLLVAVPAALAVLLAWALPAVRRRPGRLVGTLTFAAALWALAEGVVFVGGTLAQP